MLNYQPLCPELHSTQIYFYQCNAWFWFYQYIVNSLTMHLVLKIIKDAQQQHGLRHGDYQRYR